MRLINSSNWSTSSQGLIVCKDFLSSSGNSTSEKYSLPVSEGICSLPKRRTFHPGPSTIFSNCDRKDSSTNFFSLIRCFRLLLTIGLILSSFYGFYYYFT